MLRSSKYSWEIRRFELGLVDIALFAKRHAQVKKDTCIQFTEICSTQWHERDLPETSVYYLSNITKCDDQWIKEKDGFIFRFCPSGWWQWGWMTMIDDKAVK